MPRKSGSIAKKKCWNCKVILGNDELLNEDFNTLKNIAEKLKLTYAQVSEMTSKGRKKKVIHNSPYMTDIIINRIDDEIVDIEDELNSENPCPVV